MTTREIRRYLAKHGFAVVKDGSKHEIWGNGKITIPVAHGNSTNPRIASEIRSKIRKQMEMGL